MASLGRPPSNVRVRRETSAVASDLERGQRSAGRAAGARNCASHLLVAEPVPPSCSVSPATSASASVDVPDVLRLDHELDPLLPCFAVRVLVLAYVLLRQAIDVLVGTFEGR